MRRLTFAYSLCIVVLTRCVVCRQAPIGDDNYLHLAGAAGGAAGADCGAALWRAWRSEAGEEAPLEPASSTESLRLARRADDRSSGKSSRSAGSGYLAMSCVKHDPADDSDASAGRPRRPPKPQRPPPPAPPPDYVAVEPRVPVRRRDPDPDIPAPALSPPRCTEYELMADFMSHARDEPPAVPPRANASRARTHPKPAESEGVPNSASFPAASSLSSPSSCSEAASPGSTEHTRPSSADAVSTDDSLLEELQRDSYCVLRVCEDEPDPPPPPSEPFSRLSVHRKSNPSKAAASVRPLKTSSSTSNVHESGATPSASRPLTERLTPFFLKRKPKPAEDKSESGSKREDNLVGRLTPRFGQSRLYGRGRSLELGEQPRRIERSPTAVNVATRPIDSSIVANLKFLSLHRYGAGGGTQDEPPPAPTQRLTGDIRL